MVTVGVASYNNSMYVYETLDSIKNQTYKNIELIIVDDKSTDDSVDVIKKWISENNEFNARFIIHNHNRGVCAVCNTIVAHASGKYLSIVGSDDVYMPNKIERQVSVFEQCDSSIAALFGDTYIINENGELRSETLFEASGIDLGKKMSGDIFINLLKSCFIPAPSVLVRKEAVVALGGYDELLNYEDWDMWLRMAKFFKFCYVDEILVKYRVHDKSAWHSRSVKFYESTVLLLKKHLGYSHEADEIIYSHMREQAELLYMKGAKSAAGYLKEVWQHYHAPSLGVMYAMSVIGLPYTLFNRLRRLRG